MNIIIGANGQVGSQIAEELRNNNKEVVGVVRSKEKSINSTDIDYRIADLFDVNALKTAFAGGKTVFLLTPENPASKDPISETQTILNNYKEAIIHSGIKKIVGLSSMGAQHASGTGNLLMSNMLEHQFSALPVEQTYIRPAYYFSNWLGYMDTVKEYGILPTFFPVDLKIHMAAPQDVAKFIARVIMDETYKEKIYEITGPKSYSSLEIADIFGQFFKKEVKVQQIPQEEWKGTLQQVGFSDFAAESLIEMTQAVIDGKATPEKKEAELIKLKTDFPSFLESKLK